MISKEHFLKQCIGFLNTPPLWEKEQFGIRQFEFPKMELHSFQAKPIPQNIRLGHQMEYVFEQLVAYSETYEVVLQNLPIRQNKITLGEIDFVLKDKTTNKLIHVELTYKFYVINPEISEPIYRLMGPNKRDMFFTKMEKIKNEQFALLHSEEGSKTLDNHLINHTEIKHQCCYKAQLFRPYDSTSVSIHPLNTNCIVGYWLRFSDFKKDAFQPHQFYIPNKSEWVIEPHHQVPWQSHFKIMMDINWRLLKESAPMVWIKKTDTSFEKIFVVWW